MSYGFKPYDKQSYRESKKRRKQALKAAKTGRFEPIGRSKRRALIYILALAGIIIAVVLGYLIYSNIFSDNSDNTSDSELISENTELLRVVNRQNPLSESYVPELSDFNGFKVNRLAYGDLNALMEEAEKNGTTLSITSAYISFDEQQKLYNQMLKNFLDNPDYTEVRARAAAEKLVPVGGNSEAQTGLLIGFDVTSDKSAAFLERNCVNFGFVLRYPEGKDSVTHMAYDKSLYRYVGKENAVKMRSYDMCLEEYDEYLSVQNNGN